MPLEKRVPTGTQLLASMLTCFICHKLLKEGTTISKCLHSFCEKCIYNRILKENMQHCPVCHVELRAKPLELLRADVQKRSIKKDSSGIHKQTTEERAARKRSKEIEHAKGKGKSVEVLPPRRSSSPDDQGNKLRSAKQPVSTNKGKEKMTELLEQLTNKCKSVDFPNESADINKNQVRSQSKGIVIRSPLPVHENEMSSSKYKGKRHMEVRPMDKEKVGVSVTLPGSQSKEAKKRGRKKSVVAHSHGTTICPQDVVDAGMNLNPSKKTHSAWFTLAPSSEPNGKEPLQLLPEPNLNISFDGNGPSNVSTLIKYIELQLNLDKQEEVGIFMHDSLLSPKMKLLEVVNLWLTAAGLERKAIQMGSSAGQFGMKLTYARMK